MPAHNEAADAFFRVAFGAGLVAGLFWAPDHPATPKECSGTWTDSLGNCVGDTLWTMMETYLIGLGGGRLAWPVDDRAVPRDLLRLSGDRITHVGRRNTAAPAATETTPHYMQDTMICCAAASENASRVPLG